MKRSELAKVQELLKQVSEYENGLDLFKTSTARWELVSTDHGFATFIEREAAKEFITARLKATWDALKTLSVYPDAQEGEPVAHPLAGAR